MYSVDRAFAITCNSSMYSSWSLCACMIQEFEDLEFVWTKPLSLLIKGRKGVLKRALLFYLLLYEGKTQERAFVNAYYSNMYLYWNLCACVIQEFEDLGFLWTKPLLLLIKGGEAFEKGCLLLHLLLYKGRREPFPSLTIQVCICLGVVMLV